MSKLTAEHIFPTLSRIQPSKLLSYPVGAELLSRALDGVPQHSMITCNFWAGNPHHEQNKRALIFFMAVTYEKWARNFHHSQDAGERGVFDPRWKISVYAVPVDERALIKQLLLEYELKNTVYPWLVANAHMTGKTGGAALSLYFDRVKKKIIAQVRQGFPPEVLR